MKSKNTIDLNGKRYDAATGAILGVGSAPPVQAVANIDGFFRNTRASNSTPTPVAHKITVLAAPSAQQSAPAHPKSVRRHAAGHAHAHKPQSASTLMRTAVKRPASGFKQQATIQGSLQHKVPSLIATKRSAYTIDADRLARAKSVSRSPHVVHHGVVPSHHVPVTLAPLPVQPVPSKPVEVPPPPTQTNKPLDIFEHAIANASNFVDVKTHRAHFKKQARRHVTSMAAGTLALLVIAGFAAYQNTPGLQFKVASIQAGVATSMPNLKAAGFAYNGAKANNGKLTVGFSGKSGTYQLTQQNTNLSSSDMIQEISSVDASGFPDYTTVQVGNTTIYRFNNTNATWVSGGKWYQVTGTNALTDSQVVSLVKNI